MFDLDGEERSIEGEIRWAAESNSRVDSEAKSALRKLEDGRKELESEVHELKDRSDYLMEVIEGKIRPGAVDLPEDEAQNIGTKIRLRLKGVRGLAIEKARDELGPLEDKIKTTEGKITDIEERAEKLRKRKTEAKARIAELMESLRNQRALIRQISSITCNLSDVVSVFGWYNPYLLGRKCVDEIMVTMQSLFRHTFSMQRRSQEINELDRSIGQLKANLKSVLGEAYEGSLIPIVFKDGASPEGKKFLENELTCEDVKSLNLSSKISHPKTAHGKADRLRSILWEHRDLISESLAQMGHLAGLKLQARHLLEASRGNVQAAQRILDSKTQLFAQVIGAPEGFLQIRGLASAYDEQSREAAGRKERALVAIDAFGSDL